MYKGDQISPRVLEDHWKTIRPQLTKQILKENPDKPLEVLRTMKQFDEINQQLTDVLEATAAYHEHQLETLKFELAAKKSILRQKQQTTARSSVKRYLTITPKNED